LGRQPALLGTLSAHWVIDRWVKDADADLTVLVDYEEIREKKRDV